MAICYLQKAKNEVVKKIIAHKQLNLFGGLVLTCRNQIPTNENSEIVEHSESRTFKALQRETTVWKYYVELKEDVLTEQGFLDLAKVPGLYVSEVGQFLRNLRLETGLSREYLVKTFNISRNQVNNWENNYTRMPLQKLVEISETLGVSRDIIYSLIDQRKFTTKNKLPAKFEKIREIIPHLSPFKSVNHWSIAVIQRSNVPLSKIKATMICNRRHKINSKELYNFLNTFIRYTKVSKIHPPLTTEVKDWFDNGVDLKRAIILPCLQSDGDIQQLNQGCSRVRFVGKNKVLHDYIVDAIYYEYNEFPTTYLSCCSAGAYNTLYEKDSTKEIVDELMNLAGNTKTHSANRQTVEEYLKESQPHLNYLIDASMTERQIAIRIWAATEGSISVCRKNRYVFPHLQIACTHPDLATQLQQIARQFNIDFFIARSKSKWSGIQGLSTSALRSCINFLKLGGFFKGVKICATSKYHEGIEKGILLLGILEYKKRELENSQLKKLPIQQVHHEINKIIENGDYKSADHYINYFS